ncbi:MAG: hypothetical protein J6S67_14560 [Methanobrevibacter sp.]|nr:hypothetical protein [Methanobrevibacter sp.]
MNNAEIEQREQALQRAGGCICQKCGKPFRAGQYAHKIANKEMWRKKYGSFIIDHTLNGEYVCSLSCNQSVDVGSSYGNHLEVIADILIYEYQKMWGADGIVALSDKLLEKYKQYGINTGVENRTEKN